MLSGDAPTIGAAKVMFACKPCGSTNISLSANALESKESLTHTFLKPARVGVRADDIGAQRLEEACIPRDGGLEGEALQRALEMGALKSIRRRFKSDAHRALGLARFHARE